MTQSKLIYVGDPMCSWCYGISENLEAILKEYNGKLETEIVMGGLRPYNTQTMLDLKSFLTHHWEDVHKASGLEFNYGILDDRTITYDTEPPCRAVVIVRQMNPTKAFSFFKATQKAFYFNNKNMHLVESYFPILDELKLDKSYFEKKFASEIMKEKVKEDFKRSADLGVSSFPTILIEHNGQLHMIARGFASVEEMRERIDSIIN